jgi:inorganic pyrophosphatase
MAPTTTTALLELMKVLFKPHPWHGVSSGKHAPDCVTCYIEIVPTDSVKYEIDKLTGYLMVDRPQRFSNHVPCLYGLIPQTYWDRAWPRSQLKRLDAWRSTATMIPSMCAF